MKKRFFALICLGLCAALLAGCGKEGGKPSHKTEKRPDTIESSELQFQTPAEGAPIAIFGTSYGQVRAVLYPEQAPMAVENFTQLAKQGYYNGITFHRVIEGFLVQTGDATGQGNGGTTCWNGMPFPVELSAKLHHYSGALAMAHMGSDTTANFSQFYFVQTPSDSISDEAAQKLAESGLPEQAAAAYKAAGGAPYLDNLYTVFGQVYEGMEVIDEIAAAAEVDAGYRPKEDILLEWVVISSYGAPDPEFPASSGSSSDGAGSSAG